ncbi:tetratricopeptide repeat protein [Leadbetterella sp. DM7]|uniref:tetratricopeptide repeat protein n=1 Tax=Leadbetterella sp. DM7 TaxID=3235085 RepID=UPI00349EC7EE
MRYFLFPAILFLLVGCSDTSRDEYDIPGKLESTHEKQMEVILEKLSESIKSNPSNPLNYFKRAWWQYGEGNYDEALIDITRAERLSPNSGEILFLKSAILYKSGKENALENALYAEDQDFVSPDLYTLIGNLYLDKRNFGKAEEYFRKAENIYPYNSDLFNGKGRYYAMLRDTVTAVNFFKRAIHTRPGVFEYYDDLIKIYGKARQIDSALHLNEMAIAKFPDKKELLYNKGLILENAGLLDSSAGIYRQFLKVEPERFDVYERIGNIYFRKKNYPAAFITYNKWAELDNDNPMPRLKAARSYIAQDNLPAAKYYLVKSLEKYPGNALLKAELDAVNYRIESGALRSYTPSGAENYNEKDKEDERVFDRSLEINTIPKRKTTLISRDSTRN